MDRNLFTGDFETGDASQFTSSNGSVQSTTKNGGTWAGDNTDNTNFRKDVSGFYPTVFQALGDFRWDTAFGNLWYVLVCVDNSNLDSVMIRTLTNGKLRVILPDGTTYDSTNSFTINTWYTLKFEYKYGRYGWFNLYVNGVLECSAVNVNTLGTSGQEALRGVKWQGNNAASVHTYVDNCIINVPTGIRGIYLNQGFS